MQQRNVLLPGFSKSLSLPESVPSPYRTTARGCPCSTPTPDPKPGERSSLGPRRAVQSGGSPPTRASPVYPWQKSAISPSRVADGSDDLEGDLEGGPVRGLHPGSHRTAAGPPRPTARPAMGRTWLRGPPRTPPSFPQKPALPCIFFLNKSLKEISVCLANVMLLQQYRGWREKRFDWEIRTVMSAWKWPVSHSC